MYLVAEDFKCDSSWSSCQTSCPFRQKTEAVAGFTDWPYLCHLLVRHPATWVSLALLWTLPMGYSVCSRAWKNWTISCILPSSSSVLCTESLTKRCFLLILMCLIIVGSGGINLRADQADLLRIRLKDMCQHCYENHWNQVIQDWRKV